jgi:conjugal transfer mating pair stabilization protein TraG
VNLANWAGIDAVNQDVATMAGFLMLSVPLLALMVMRGTMSVANNLGSMLAPVQAGSDAAALERTTGNYAYGDVSYGNLNAENRQSVAVESGAEPPVRCRPHSGFREADGRMFNEYGSGHSVIDTNAAISQLPFKPTMTRGYATDLRSQGQWYLNEADKIENGTSSSWTSSKGPVRQCGHRDKRCVRSPARKRVACIRHPQCRRQRRRRRGEGQLDARGHQQRSYPARRQ